MRTVTINTRRLPMYERQAWALEAGDTRDLPYIPRTRGECKDGPRPCPFVSCRHHLYLEAKGDKIKMNFPDMEPDELRWSCSLDVADRGGITLEEVGSLMNITRERVRQIEGRAAHRVRRLAPDILQHLPGKP